MIYLPLLPLAYLVDLFHAMCCVQHVLVDPVCRVWTVVLVGGSEALVEVAVAAPSTGYF